MFCQNCGNPLEDDARFCVNCGTPIEAPAETDATPPAEALNLDTESADTAADKAVPDEAAAAAETPAPTQADAWVAAAPAAPVQYAQPQYAQPQYAQLQYAQPQYVQPQYAPYPATAAPKKKKLPVWALILIIVGALVVIGGTILLVVLFSGSKPTTIVKNSIGFATTEEMADAYMEALQRGQYIEVVRLFPNDLRLAADDADFKEFVDSLDAWTQYYGTTVTSYSVIGEDDYDDESRQGIADVLNRSVDGYRDVLVGAEFPSGYRTLHIDMVQIDDLWYITEIWNDDLTPTTGFDTPEQAMNLYFSSIGANDVDAVCSSFAPALVSLATGYEYGERGMLDELDYYYGAGFYGSVCHFSNARYEEYNDASKESFEGILGVSIEEYGAYYITATFDGTDYNMVIDLIKVDGVWGIAEIWDSDVVNAG